MLNKWETMTGTENQLGIQLPSYQKIMDLGAELTISTLLKQDNPQQ